MRIIGRLLILAAATAALLAALNMLVTGNTQAVRLNLPDRTIQASLGFVVAAALVLGVLLALLLLLPGRIRAAWRNRRLRRRAQKLEDELRALREWPAPPRLDEHPAVAAATAWLASSRPLSSPARPGADTRQWQVGDLSELPEEAQEAVRIALTSLLATLQPLEGLQPAAPRHSEG